MPSDKNKKSSKRKPGKGPATPKGKPEPRSKSERSPRASSGSAPRKAAGKPYDKKREGDSFERKRSTGDKPFDKKRDDKPAGRKPVGDKPPYARKSTSDKPYSEKRSGDRSFEKSRESRPPGWKPKGDKPPFSPNKVGERAFDKKPEDQSADRKPAGDKPYAPKRAGDRPFDKRKPTGKPPYGKRRDDEAPEERKPYRGKAGGRTDRTDSNRPRGKGHKSDNRKDYAAPRLPKTRPMPEEGMRLNKFLAHAGVASRRKADEIIAQGLIKVNGSPVLEMGHKVLPTDTVTFDGTKVTIRQQFFYILLNKPKNYITTTNDEKDRKTVMALVENATDERIYPVGRLDRATTGLLLLTNDGDLAQKLTHPKHGVKKIYHVTLSKPVTEGDLERIALGLTLEDGPAPVDQVAHVDNKDLTQVGIQIHIGKNRIVRRIFEHLGYSVEKLDRVYYAGLTKKDLPRGRWRHLDEKEVIMLKHFT